MLSWDDAAAWYLGMVGDPEAGFNDVAGEAAVELLGPCGGLRVLDLGCGEGHVARRLARHGAQVVGVDPTRALLEAARAAERDQPLGIDHRLGGAEHLGSVGDATIDAVLAVLSLHHVEELGAALGEAHRVLRPGGRLVAVVPHPWSDHRGARWVSDGPSAGRVTGADLDEGPWREGTEAERSPLVSVRRVGWYHRTVATWLTSVATAGFCLVRAVEPAGAGSARSDGGGLWADVPRFLGFVAAALER